MSCSRLISVLQQLSYKHIDVCQKKVDNFIENLKAANFSDAKPFLKDLGYPRVITAQGPILLDMAELRIFVFDSFEICR